MNSKSADRLLQIEKRLKQALSPDKLEVIDESHLHIGHPGAQSGAGHFLVTISSPSFTGKTRIDCHRQIYAALGDLMDKDIHALRLIIE